MRKRNYLTKIILISLLCLTSWNVFAKNLGTIGATYPIAELDLRQVFQQRLLRLQQTGELDQLTLKLNQTLQQQMDRPHPVSGLKRTTQPRIRLFDPAVRIPYDLKNADGNIILPAGTTINPLETIRLSERLLFYNADDPDQVRWVQQQIPHLKSNDKLILVGGSVASQMKLFKRAVFFDQGNRLTSRFQIKQVPAMMMQQGNRLKIQEISP